MTPRAGRRPLAITGIGPVTSVGIGVSDFWAGLASGRSGAGPITAFDTTEFSVKIASEVTAFEPRDYMDLRMTRRLARFSQFALAGAKLALADASLILDDVDRDRVGVVIGTGVGGMTVCEEQYRVLLEQGPSRVSPEVTPLLMPNAAAAGISIVLGLRGPNEATATACASSGHAIARAADLIHTGAADVVLAGGTEATVSPFGIAAFGSGRVLSTRNHDPARASRPFDAHRDGFVLAEGATVLVLERPEHAAARDARVYAEIVGCGLSSDAHNLTAPLPHGDGAAACMQLALDDADLAPGDVDYVNAHATSTTLGDVAEARALRKVFGSQPPPASSTKSMTGHLIGAAGATEAAVCALALTHGLLPPTINVDDLDPACDLDVVPNAARPASPRVAVSNTFGFGGHNASLVLRREAD